MPNHQEQIVELRVRLDQLIENNAATIEYLVKREVAQRMDEVAPTLEEVRQLREIIKARAARKAMLHDIGVHLAKWGAGGVVGFVAYSVWERVKGLK